VGVVHSDDFESGASLASQSIYDFIHDCEVVADGGLGGTYCVQTTGSPASGGNFLVGEWVEGTLNDIAYGGITSSHGTTALTPSGRTFRISACFDHSQTPWSTGATYDGPAGLAILVRRSTPYSGAYSSLFTLNHLGYDASQASLRLYKGQASTFVDEVFIPKDTNTSIAVEVQMSTVTGGDERGGGTAASDGYIRVYVDGALVIDHSSAQIGHFISNQGPSTYWNSWANVDDPFTSVQFGPMGRLKNVCVRDDLDDCGFSCTPFTGIRVHKVTVPGGSSQGFTFTAGGGLSPASFTLVDGEDQTFEVAAGSGYTISEDATPGWSTSITVSNGSSTSDLTVEDGEITVVTVTNTQITTSETDEGPCCGTTGPGGAPTSTGYNGTGTTGPVGTTPPTTTPRVIPPGGEVPSYSTCASGGGTPATASDPTDAQVLSGCRSPLIHMNWTLPDASVRRYGKIAFTSGNGQAVSRRVLKWGAVSQVLADRHGSFQANQFTVTLSDYDRAIRTIISTGSTKHIDGEEVEILAESRANAALSVNPLVLARGVVTNYKFNRDLTVDLTITDPLGYRYSSVSLDRPIPHRVLRRELFPNLPEETSGRAQPIIYGEESDDYTWSITPARIPVGICPVIYVGPANTISAAGIPGGQWEAFLVAGHALSCFQSVFASNLLDTPGPVRMSTSTYGSEFLIPGINVPKYYDITGSDGVTERVCLMFATGERAIDHIEGRVPITVNVQGIEDVGDGSGDMISETALQFQHFLQHWVVQNYLTGSWGAVPTFGDGTAKVRTSSFSAANAVHAARMGTALGYIGSMYIGDQKPARDWGKEFQSGGDMRLGVNHQGQLVAITLDHTQSTAALTTYTDEDHTVEDSFEIDPQVDEIFNIYTYEYGVEPATGRKSGLAQTVRHGVSITNHGERVAQASVNRATRQKPTADDVANRALLQSFDAPTDVTFDLDLRGADLRLGQLVKVTHYQGVGALGWTERNLMVAGTTAYPDEDNFSTSIRLEDWHDVLALGGSVLEIDTGTIDTYTIG
jgi:hypothetical protein